MLKYVQKRFAMSEKGARDFLKGSLWTTIQNFSLMLPVILLYLFLEYTVKPYLETGDNTKINIGYYIMMIIASIVTIYIIGYFQYNNTYMKVYEESAVRRISLAEKLRKLPLSFFGEKNLSDLTATIMSDATDLEHTFSHAVPQLFGSTVMLILAFLGLSFMNWKLTLALFWVVPVAILMLLFSKQKQKKEHQTAYLQKRSVSEKIQEGIEQIQEIKSYNHEQTYMNELKQALDSYENMQIKGELFIGIVLNSIQSIIKLGLPTVILTGASMLINGTVDFITYLFFLIITSSIYDPILNVLNQGAILFFLDIRIKRMNEVLNLPIQTGINEYNLKNYNICFKHVNFAYKNNNKVLQDVSFTAEQGKITALIGPSGGGKSTAAKLAARFWDIDSGEITLGTYPISSIDPESLLKNFSIVFQDVVLFNASILDNIRIGKKDATNKEVLHAASLAQCDEFVEKLPYGYNTVIGENGSTLSGGERQRISIARAILKDAPIILLDEATASLDVENETKIQKALSTLLHEKTVLIIAHRMRTIAHADKIIVLKDGKIAEQGSPKELLKLNGAYKNMLTLQNEVYKQF